MDPEKHVIILKGNQVDRCEDISRIYKNGKKVVVYFNDGKKFDYNENNVEWFTRKVECDFSQYYIYFQGKLFNNFLKVWLFEDKFYKFKFNYGYRTYHKSELIFKENCNKNDQVLEFLSYLKEIAQSIPDETNEEFLPEQLDKINVKEDSCLYRYATGKMPKKLSNKSTLIFPYGSNSAQKQSVKNAFESSMSIIQGPPGTGKTQTILNIIANVIIRNKTVAIVSNNNTATENVEEKLQKSGFGFLTAFLGNKDNLDTFFSEVHPIPSEVDGWLCKEKIAKYFKELNEYEKFIETSQKNQIEIARKSHSIEELKIEKAIHDAEYSINQSHLPINIKEKHFTSDQLLTLKAELEILSEKKLKNFFVRVRFLFRFGLFNLPKNLKNKNDVIDFIDNQFYQVKISELEKEKQELEKYDLENNTNQIEERIKQIYMTIFKHFAAKRVQGCVEQKFDRKYFRSDFHNLIKRHPIMLNTTHSLLSSTNNDYLYDFVIIDEASQVSIVTAAIAISKARNIILVGDRMQLTHIVKSQHKTALENIFAKYNLKAAYEYSRNSILDSFDKLYKDSIPNVLLNEHYRCDPQIIDFCNKRFYDNQLVIRTKRGIDQAVTILHTKAHAELNRANERQVCAIEEILPELTSHDVGIIAPFKNQVYLLQDRFKKHDFKIETIHKFQGQEKEVIVLSTVLDRIKIYDDSETEDFLNNSNLINVAISRAKSKLILVISEELMKQNGAILSDFTRYIKYFCDRAEVIKSSVYSVFDLMYKDYSKKLEPLMKKIKKVSEFPSENIIEALINEIKEEKKYGCIDYHKNYALRNIIKVDQLEDEADIQFVSNANTHCDFIIFNQFDKSIMFVIEVDGKQHAWKTQRVRDERKDRLLQAAGIEVLRLRTTDIVHKETIENVLKRFHQNNFR